MVPALRTASPGLARALALREPSRQALLAVTLYLALALAYTWPLASGLTGDVPWDMGDPLLNIWILGWGAEHLLRGLTGDLQALTGFWNANIFHPEPLTLAYSEHLLAQVIQILPVYALTGNLVLCYNLLFLSTFVLAGLGMFLFVREVTSSAVAGFVAGLVFAFMPLRVAEFSHLQVMSSQWMPFVLFGMRRYFETGRRRALAGASLALVVQNLSCGYFLLYFAPFAGAYGLWELSSRRRISDLTAWRELALAAAVVVVTTVPFLLPYLQLRELGFRPRPLREVASYSADVYSYLTASASARLDGQRLGIRVFPKPEGELFPSVAALVLAAAGIWASLRAARERRAGSAAATSDPWYVRSLLVVAVAYASLSAAVLGGFGFTYDGLVTIRATDVARLGAIAATSLIVALIFGRRTRSGLARWCRMLPAFCVLAAAAAVVLSWGPTVTALGRPVSSAGPYLWLYQHVPGFDGLRVPARYGVVAMVFVSVLCGLGAHALQTRWRRVGALCAVLLGLGVAVEGMAAPIVLNGVSAVPGLASPPAHVQQGAAVPPEYQAVRGLPVDAVLIEFPFGYPDYELRYVYYSTTHWRRLVNGYSGTFPPSYEGSLAVLRDPPSTPERSWTAVQESGASHAIVHEDAYRDPVAARAVTAWLIANGAQLVTEVAGAQIFSLPRRVAGKRP